MSDDFARANWPRLGSVEVAVMNEFYRVFDGSTEFYAKSVNCDSERGWFLLVYKLERWDTVAALKYTPIEIHFSPDNFAELRAKLETLK